MTTVLQEFRVNETAGDLGIEIEVEGLGLPTPTKYWRREVDGSLRGEESAEYVFRKPLDLKLTKTALEYLDKAYELNHSRVDDTVRAGVHVHVNCQKLTMTQLYNYMTLFYVLENVLTKFCGEYRQGNLFCLRSCDADRQLHVIRTAAKSRDFRRSFHHDNNRYAAMNIKALGDYGSLEFRCMRSTRDMSLIYSWAKSLYDLREKAKTFECPHDIIALFSQHGPEGFIKLIMDDNAKIFLDEYKSTKEFNEDMWKGMRNAQDIAFCADWYKWNMPPRKIGQLEFDALREGNIDEPDDDF